MTNVAFIGVGKLGLECATEMMKAGHNVVGYDTKQIQAPFPMANDLKDTVTGADIIFIAVPTPHRSEYGGHVPASQLPPQDFDYTIVKEILTSLNALCTSDQLVVLISTVLPGTTRREFVPLIKSYNFIYNPYLIAMGSTAWDMVNPEMVIIGTEDGSITIDAKILIDFYSTMMQNNPRYEIGTWDEAECIKIFYNTFISAKISLVNMIQDAAQKIGHINADVVANALAKSSQRIMGPSFMKPGMGDAGACHPRDNIALSWMAQHYNFNYDIFKTIMQAREIQALHLATKLAICALDYKLPIFIHGLAYKPGVEYTDGSYSYLIGHYIRNHYGQAVRYIDPLCGETPESVQGVILMAHHAPTTYSHSHVIGTDHQALYCKIEDGSVIVDPWRVFTAADFPNCTVIRYGDTR